MSRDVPRAGLAAGLAAALLTAGGCASSSPSGAATASEGLVVRRGDLEDRFLLTGELEALRSVELTTPRTDVWTLSILWLAEEGARVETGDPVVQFDSAALASQVEDRRLAVLQAEKQLERRQVELEAQHEQRLLDTWRKRIERDKAALEASIPASLQSARDYQDKQLALEKAEVELRKSERELESFDVGAEADLEIQRIELAKARRDLQRVESTMDQLTLRAPVAGVVLHAVHPIEERKFRPGDTAMPGFVVAELPDPHELRVVAFLSDVDEGRVVPGLEAHCTLDTYPERVFAAHVIDVTEYARERSRRTRRRAFVVRLDLDEPDPEVMRPGMSVKVEVVRARWEDGLLAPRSALGRAEDGGFLLETTENGLVAVSVAGCDAVDCLLSDGPPAGTALRSVR